VEAFEYISLDKQGKQQRGTVQADNARQVRQLLREQNLIPLTVQRLTGEAENTAGKPRKTALKRGELPLLIRQLATLVAAGLPLEQAISTTIEQSEQKNTRKVLMELRARLLEGHTLARAMRRFPRAFDELTVTTIEAGEESGHLPEVLDRLAAYLEEREDRGKQSLMALMYPLILVITAIAVVSGLMVYIVPKVIQIFERSHAQLPVITRALLALTDWLSRYGWLLFSVIAVAVLLFTVALQNPDFRLRWHAFLLRLPLIGPLIRTAQAARFTRTLGILTKSSVPIVPALALSAQVVNNLAMRQAVDQAAARVREGSSLNRAIRESGQFPPLTVRLIHSGEQSGTLSDMLERAASAQERDVSHRLNALVSVMQPVAILIVGVLILLIVLAMLLPIFQINTLLT
jgi:general secretion pathway protein F